MTHRTTDTDSHREFYDEFLTDRMVDYRLHGNLRIDRAIGLVTPHVQPFSRVLDIGCGIGLATEKVAAAANRGRVWACDLSPANIQFARATVKRQNIEFFACDVLNDFDTVRSRVDEPLDIVMMVDVLEHLPLSAQTALFEGIGELLAKNALVLLTFPSPAFQEYLRTHKPERLQPVDEDLPAGWLERLAEASGTRLQRYEAIDVWMSEQYVHCVLSRGRTLVQRTPGLAERVLGRARNVLRRRVLWPVRRQRLKRQWPSLDPKGQVDDAPGPNDRNPESRCR